MNHSSSFRGAFLRLKVPSQAGGARTWWQPPGPGTCVLQPGLVGLVSLTGAEEGLNEKECIKIAVCICLRLSLSDRLTVHTARLPWPTGSAVSLRAERAVFL